MSFTGFPDEGLVFYEGLEADNSKSFWTEHKSTYDEHVKVPMQALVEELAAEFGTPKLFRPYRDVRFSKDKTPYKTHQGAVLHLPGAGVGAWYVEVSADGLQARGGSWRMQPDQVERYRRAVDDDVPGGQLEQIVAKLRRGGITVDGDRLKRTPRGYDADHVRVELLRHKSIHGGRHWTPEDWLDSREVVARVQTTWRALVPLNQWLADNVGATTAPPDRRR
ncbi:DUF2461 domain-containing protein [Modestobacter sp. Leaf380]|uniref:DUF2461 domain-containing protein n=1 Tax=Modestobacter sp. Leaf380 TaxID=1736356 RepID=UPI0006FF517B|nr:DUF2461 domain-containing protein [Modestobacter sp. Leaf380]KQS67543.1 hypothetical protein ASG41_22690 [Modestobacter sp. Leaf380]